MFDDDGNLSSNESAIAVVSKPEAALALQPGTPEFERTSCWMAQEYHDGTREIERLIRALHERCERLEAAFALNVDDYARFGVDVHYNGHSYALRYNADLAPMFAAMKREAWGVLSNTLGIKNVMSVAKRAEFERQLESGELPPITAETIVSVLMGLAGQAKEFAQEAAKEVFDLLRPRGHWAAKFKTNNAFRVGKRVILPWYVDSAYRGSFRVCYSHEQHLTATDGVFHLLDGKGVMRENRGPLLLAINASSTGIGETEYFKFKCCKNRNLHLEFKRLDLVKELNMLAVGERVLGDDIS